MIDGGQRLGRYITHYRDMYFLPDKRNQQVIFSWKPEEFAENIIYDKISDITISMKNKDYLKLPDLVENDVIVEMDESEKQIYKNLKYDMVTKIGDEEIDAVVK